VIIRCYETPEGREIDLRHGFYSLTLTEGGCVKPQKDIRIPLKQYITMLEQAAEVDFEATWASHFEGVPYAPSDRAAP